MWGYITEVEFVIIVLYQLFFYVRMVGEVPLYLQYDLFRWVDEFYPLANFHLNNLPQQRVVRAAEDERVNVVHFERLEIFPGDSFYLWFFNPIFFGQRDKQWTGLTEDLKTVPQFFNFVFINSAINRSARANHPDALIASGGHGPSHGRGYYLKDWGTGKAFF